MFSVRLFIAVAGVLLMSEANQPEAITHQGRLNQNLESRPFLVTASNENEKAMSILHDSLLHKYPFLTSSYTGLLLVQKELIALIEGTVENRSGHLLAALGYEFFGYFYQGQCTDNSKCDEVSKHVQLATAKMIAAFLKESIDEGLKSKIKDLIKGNMTENGDIPEGVSPQQTLKVAKQVYFDLS